MKMCISGEPSFLLPYCLSVIKVSLSVILCSYLLHPPPACPWPALGFHHEKSASSMDARPRTRALPPLSLPSGLTAFVCAWSTQRLLLRLSCQHSLSLLHHAVQRVRLPAFKTLGNVTLSIMVSLHSLPANHGCSLSSIPLFSFWLTNHCLKGRCTFLFWFMNCLCFPLPLATKRLYVGIPQVALW